MRDWKEIYSRNSDEVLRQQGGRCMACGIPFCQQGCPLGNEIPRLEPSGLLEELARGL